jgi:hypothetical protein
MTIKYILISKIDFPIRPLKNEFFLNFQYYVQFLFPHLRKYDQKFFCPIKFQNKIKNYSQMMNQIKIRNIVN